MKIYSILIVFFLHAHQGWSQTTLVKIFPTDTFDLSCKSCVTEIGATAITKGQQSIPINLDKPVKENLLHWAYYDEVSKEEVIMEERPVWTEGKQLVKKLGAEETISYHLNITVSDTALGTKYRIFMVLSGINRSNLDSLPLKCTYDPDTYAIFRFSAMVQVIEYALNEKPKKVTYDCTDGTCVFYKLDTETGKCDATFEFASNRMGMEQRIIFVNGHLLK